MQSQKKKSKKIEGSTKRATINFGFDGKITYVKNSNKVLGFSRPELLGKKFASFLVSPYDSLFQPALLCKFLESEAQQLQEVLQSTKNSFPNALQSKTNNNNQQFPWNQFYDLDQSYLPHIPFIDADVLNDLIAPPIQNLNCTNASAQISAESHKRKRSPQDDEKDLTQPVLKRAIIECVGKKGEHIPLLTSVLMTTKGGASRESIFSCSLQKLENETLVTVKDNGIIIYCDENFPSIFGHESAKAVGSNICNIIPSYNRHVLQIQLQKAASFKANFVGTNGYQKIFLRVEGVQTSAREFTLWSLKISRVDTLMDALLGINESGTILSASGFCELLLGYSSSQLCEKNVQHFIQTVPSMPTAVPKCATGSQVMSVPGSTTDALSSKPNVIPFSLVENSNSSFECNSDKNTPLGSPMLSNSKPSSDALNLLTLQNELYFLLQDGWWAPVSTRLIPVTENSSNTAFYLQISRTSMDEYWEHPSEAIGNYYFVSPLGKGSSSNVWLGMRKTDFHLFAIKSLKPGSNNTTHVHDESEILKSLHHPHIVQFVEEMHVNDTTHIVLEHIDGVDLMTLVSQSNGLPESLARAIFMQVLSALRYCHLEAKIVHRDLKPQNIIIDKLGRIKLIDFGFAHKIDDGPRIHCMCGTPAFAPPCLLAGKCLYGPEIDMWSLGIVLYAMVTNKLPFSDVQQVMQGTFEEPAVSPDCLDLIHMLLERDAKKRASYEQVIHHPWLARTQSRYT